jgi:hypothetical protein
MLLTNQHVSPYNLLKVVLMKLFISDSFKPSVINSGHIKVKQSRYRARQALKVPRG